jgi:uncharacterized MnhB-related membrane protein
MIWYVLIVVGMIGCAIQAIRVRRLLMSALWLAGCSALVALLMYLMGAPEIAVIELSVGAGLVTVLFVFAINIAGEEARTVRRIIPAPLSWLLVAISAVLLAWFTLPGLAGMVGSPAQPDFAAVLWGDRQLDMLLQTVLIFAGTLGVIGLLSDARKPHAPKEKS